MNCWILLGRYIEIGVQNLGIQRIGKVATSVIDAKAIIVRGSIRKRHLRNLESILLWIRASVLFARRRDTRKRSA